MLDIGDGKSAMNKEPFIAAKLQNLLKKNIIKILLQDRKHYCGYTTIRKSADYQIQVYKFEKKQKMKSPIYAIMKKFQQGIMIQQGVFLKTKTDYYQFNVLAISLSATFTPPCLTFLPTLQKEEFSDNISPSLSRILLEINSAINAGSRNV